MSRLLKSTREIWKNLDRNIYSGGRYKSNMKALFMVSMFSAALGLILIIVNLLSVNTTMLLASVLTLVSGVCCAICVKILKNREIAIIIPVMFCMVIITVYVLTAAGSGSAILWTILVPIGISYFVKVKYGIILSAYYTVLIFIVFFSPFREHYSVYYKSRTTSPAGGLMLALQGQWYFPA